MDANVKKERSQDRSLWDAVFKTSWSTFPSTTGGEGKTAVINKFCYHFAYVPVRQKLEEFAN